MATVEGQNEHPRLAGRDEHLRLAGIVKGLHADLRKKFKKCTDADDFEQIWKEHCKDTDTLRQYADAMHHLATDHWTRLPETRIDWCRKTIVEYFHGGGLKKALEKVARRIKVHQARKLQNECLDQKKNDKFEAEQLDPTDNSNSEKVVLCSDVPTHEFQEVDIEKADTDSLPVISTDM